MPAPSIETTESWLDQDSPPAAPPAEWKPSWRKAPPEPEPDEKATPETTTRTIGAPQLVLGLLVGAGAAAFAVSREHGVLIGQIAAPAIVIPALHGAFRGGLRKVGMLPIVLGIATLVAARPRFAEPLVRWLAGPSNTVANGIAAAVLAGFAFFACRWLLARVHRRWIATRPRALMADRIAGCIVGAAEGTLLVLSFCWVALAARTPLQTIHDHPTTVTGSTREVVTATLLRLGDEAGSENAIGSLIRETSPIERLPALKEAFEQANSGGKINIGFISPELFRTINSVLGTTAPADADDTAGPGLRVEPYQSGNEALDRAYRRLPPPTGPK